MKIFLALFLVTFLAQEFNCERLDGLSEKDGEEGWKVIADQAIQLVDIIQKQKGTFDALQSAHQSSLKSSQTKLSNIVGEFKSRIESLEPKCRDEAESSLQVALMDSTTQLDACPNSTQIKQDLQNIEYSIFFEGFLLSGTLTDVAWDATSCLVEFKTPFKECFSSSYPKYGLVLFGDLTALLEVAKTCIRLSVDLDAERNCHRLNAESLQQKLESVISEAHICSKKM